ncbi:hypothetical protein [Nocardia sp. NBC_00511]|uniref:hypothetical protein n=1 Tax=Nocardia sp. NBC_00511 TaxID=2903591 RepID=UPI0030E1F268
MSITARLAGIAVVAGLCALAGVTVGSGAAGAYSLGAPCYGYQIGMQSTDDGTGDSIICDSDYTWEEYVGQVPHHDWADNQTDWAQQHGQR